MSVIFASGNGRGAALPGQTLFHSGAVLFFQLGEAGGELRLLTGRRQLGDLLIEIVDFHYEEGGLVVFLPVAVLGKPLLPLVEGVDHRQAQIAHGSNALILIDLDLEMQFLDGLTQL